MILDFALQLEPEKFRNGRQFRDVGKRLRQILFIQIIADPQVIARQAPETRP